MIENEFKYYMDKVSKMAFDCDVYVEVISSFRSINSKIKRSLAPPNDHSAYHIGHAIDAVFYRTYPLLYHKFGNRVIFRWGNLYSLCTQETSIIRKYVFRFFYQKKIGD